MNGESAVSFSDSMKLLAMLDVPELSGTDGVDEEVVPYYVLILKELGKAGFGYTFDFQPDLASRWLNRDLEALIEAEYVSRNSPLKVTQDGKHFLGQSGVDITALEAEYGRVLHNFIGQPRGDLLALAYKISTASD